MKMKKLLAVILSAAMAFGMMSFSVFADETAFVPSYTWYTADTTEYSISTAAELAGLANIVNGTANDIVKDDFINKTILLSDDIDLLNNEWTPIGKSGSPFSGTFNGQNYTIKNLKISGNSNDSGLFGFTTQGAVKNFVLENASVKGDMDVGAIAGTPYTSKYTNIEVKGLIQIDGYAYVGGAFGKNGYADITNVDVIGDSGSYVKADSGIYRTYVGGLIGFMGEGNITISECNVKIDVTGSTCDVGGVTGILHYGNKMVNCTYEGSLAMTNAIYPENIGEIGGLAGTYLTNANSVTTISNSTATVANATVSVNETATDVTKTITAAGSIYNEESKTAGVYDLNATVNEKTETLSNAAASIGNKKYISLANAAADAKDGDTITVETNISDMSVVTIAQGKNITIDLNGKTIETALESEGRHYYAFNNYGTLTLKDSSDDSTGTIKSRGIYNYAGGAITIENGNYYSVDNNGGACVWNTANSTLTIKDGTFTAWDPESTVEPEATVGPGCLSNAGTAYIYGGTFNDYNKRCYAIISTGTTEITPDDGKEVSVYGVHGALGIDSGKITINGGSYSSQNYYGLYAATGNTTVIVNGGTFDGKNNSVCLEKYEDSDDYCTIEINNGTFKKGFSHTSNTDRAKILVKNGTFATDVSDFCVNGYEATANGDGTYSITVKITWTTDTDSGYYMSGDAKLGIMRFIFNADIDGDVTEYGIKYINADDISASPSGSNVSGTGNVKSFYGDVDGAPESAAGTYYARAFVKTANGTFWSNPVSCKIDWNKLLDYTVGGVQ